MAKGKIRGITIEIGADTAPLSKAFTTANKTISQTQKELRDVNKLLKLDPSNTQLLQQKQVLVAEAIKATNTKLEEEKQALEKLRTAGNTEETQQQQRALERDIIATEKSLENLVSESEKTKRALDGMGDEAEKSGKEAKNASEGFTVLKGAVANLAADAVRAAGRGLKILGKESVEAVKDAAAAGDEIDKMSQKLGLSRKSYQEWDYVLAQAGFDINSLQTGMKTMTNKIDAAKKGTSSAVSIFDKLGLSVKDLEGMSREDTFSAIITSLQGMEDSTERAALANKLFGKSGQKLTPLLNQGAEATAELKKQANELGAVMSDEAITAGVKFEDQISALKGTFQAVKNGIISDLLPGVTTALSGIQQLLAGDKNGAQNFQKGIEETIAKVSEVLGKSKKLIEPIISSIISVLPSIISTITSALIALLPSLVSSLTSITQPLLQTLLNMTPELIIVVTNIALTLMNNLSAMLPQIVSAIIKIVPLLVRQLSLSIPQLLEGAIVFLTAIVDALPILIKQLTTMLPQVVNTLTKFLTNPTIIMKLLKAALTLLGAIIKAIPQIALSILKSIPLITNAIASGLRSGISKIGAAMSAIADRIRGKLNDLKSQAITWGKDLITNFVSGIKNSLYKITDAMKKIGQKIKSLIGFSEPSEGPLSNFHTFAPDMIDLFIKGINDSLPKLQSAVDNMASVAAGSAGTVTNNRNVTVNQYNTYASPHSAYEIWQSERSLERTINNTVRGAV